jgi:hypothetical protein
VADRTAVQRLLIIVAVLLAGCTPPPTPDPAIGRELRSGIAATLDAMAMPAAERPSERALGDHVGLLSIQSPPERQALIRAGALGPDAVVGAARDRLFAFTRDRPGLTPPSLLVWLANHPRGLDTNQLLLLDALTSQLEREAKLTDR